ncbi:beta-2-microglobulin-like [Cheilinus undulatus]|uniref:beta-2-microglobulin-like n=1 Tax=Cheilinus undulatus TaxID=241271 RepID=UPI001BD46D6B|nr:beta-2-microglobulin-like [Cheilinus undulatus]
MKSAIVTLALCLLAATAVQSSSGKYKVNVYSHDLGFFGKPNTLICHVSRIAPPPEIEINLLKNGEVIKGANQTDLAFDVDWYYYLTKHIRFTPQAGDRYSCQIKHGGKVHSYQWEPDQ